MSTYPNISLLPTIFKLWLIYTWCIFLFITVIWKLEKKKSKKKKSKKKPENERLNLKNRFFAVFPIFWLKLNVMTFLQSYAAYPHKNVPVLTFRGFPGISSDWCVVWSLFFYERKGVMSENVLDTLNMAFSHVENVLRRFENNFHTQKWEFVRNFELGSELKFSKSTKTYRFWFFVVFQA